MVAEPPPTEIPTDIRHYKGTRGSTARSDLKFDHAPLERFAAHTSRQSLIALMLVLLTVDQEVGGSSPLSCTSDKIPEKLAHSTRGHRQPFQPLRLKEPPRNHADIFPGRRRASNGACVIV
jgi:hypothetical protein